MFIFVSNICKFFRVHYLVSCYWALLIFLDGRYFSCLFAGRAVKNVCWKGKVQCPSHPIEGCNRVSKDATHAVSVRADGTKNPKYFLDMIFSYQFCCFLFVPAGRIGKKPSHLCWDLLCLVKRPLWSGEHQVLLLYHWSVAFLHGVLAENKEHNCNNYVCFLLKSESLLFVFQILTDQAKKSQAQLLLLCSTLKLFL